MARLYMRYAIPFYLEERLQKKFGFQIAEKKFNDKIVFVKHKKKTGVAHKPTLVYSVNDPTSRLTDAEKKALEKRCDAIVDFFPDPYNAIPAVRVRLHNMCQSLKTVAERTFVLEFIEANFPLNLHHAGTH